MQFAAVNYWTLVAWIFATALYGGQVLARPSASSSSRWALAQGSNRAEAGRTADAVDERVQVGRHSTTFSRIRHSRHDSQESDSATNSGTLDAWWLARQTPSSSTISHGRSHAKQTASSHFRTAQRRNDRRQYGIDRPYNRWSGFDVAALNVVSPTTNETTTIAEPLSSTDLPALPHDILSIIARKLGDDADTLASFALVSKSFRDTSRDPMVEAELLTNMYGPVSSETIVRALHAKRSDDTVMLLWRSLLKTNNGDTSCTRGILCEAIFHGRDTLLRRLLVDALPNMDSLARSSVVGCAVELMQPEILRQLIDEHQISVGPQIYDIIVMACFTGDLDTVRYLFEHVVSIEGLAFDPVLDAAPLTYAIGHGHLEVVKYLSERMGYQVNIDETMLRLAAGSPSVEVLRYLFDAANTVPSRDFLGTMVVEAATKDQVVNLRFLAEEGADMHFQHERPLVAAIYNGHLATATYFLDEHAADVNVNNGEPLFVATGERHPAIMRMLIDRGAQARRHSNVLMEMAFDDSSKPLDDEECAEIVSALLHQGQIDPSRLHTNFLEIAVTQGLLAVVKLLLDHGADPARDKWSALFHAVSRSDGDMVNKMLATNPHSIVDFHRMDSDVALALVFNVPILDLLMRRGLRHQRSMVKRLCQLSAFVGSLDGVRYLFKVRAVTADHDLIELFGYALHGGNVKLVALIHQRVSVEDATTRQILVNRAVTTGNVDIVRFLIQRGFPVESGSREIPSPLAIAIAKDDSAMVKLLLDMGADPNEQPEILTRVVRLGDDDLVQMLVDRMPIVSTDVTSITLQASVDAMCDGRQSPVVLLRLLKAWPLDDSLFLESLQQTALDCDSLPAYQTLVRFDNYDQHDYIGYKRDDLFRAATANATQCVRWLLDGYTIPAAGIHNTLLTAIGRSNAEMSRMLLDKVEVIPQIDAIALFERAIRGGNIDVLAALLEAIDNVLPEPDRLIALARSSGNQSILNALLVTTMKTGR